MINAPQSVIDALESGKFTYANIIDINLGDAYASGTELILHLTDHGGNIWFGGEEYLRDNHLTEIEGISRKASTGSDKVDVSFSFTDKVTIEAIVSRRYVNKPTTIRRVLLDDVGAVIGGFAIPIRTAWGLSHTIEGDLDDRKITLTIDSQLGDLESDNGWYVVNSSHQQRYPDDMIMNHSSTVMTDEQAERYTTDFNGVISQQNKPPALSAVYGYKNVDLVPLSRQVHYKSHSSYRHHYTTWIYAVCIGDAEDVDLQNLMKGDERFDVDIVTSTATDQSGWEMRLRRPGRSHIPILDDPDFNFFFDYMDTKERARYDGMYGKGLTLLFLYNRSRDGVVDDTPELKVPVVGHKIYDPRTGEYAVSRNPALQYNDYLSSHTYGAGGRGITVSEEDVITLADHFDTIPDSEGNEGINSILIDVQVDTSAALVDNMNIWIEGVRLYTSDYYGEFRLRVETKAATTYHYDENDLLGFPEYESGEYTDRLNQLTYTVNQLVTDTSDDAEAGDLVEVSVEATFPEDGSDIHTEWLTEDAGVHHYESEELSYVTELEQAYYWAMVDSRISRNPDELTLNIGAIGWLHEVGDVISFTSLDMGMSASTWRIEEVSEDDGELTLDLKPYSDTYYTPDPNVIPAPIAPAQPPKADAMTAVEDLTVNVVDDKYQISWKQEQPSAEIWFSILVTCDTDDGQTVTVVDAPIVYTQPYIFESVLEGDFTVQVTKLSTNNEAPTATVLFRSASPVAPTVDVEKGATWITLTPKLLTSSLGTRFKFYIADELVNEGYSFSHRGLLPLTQYEYDVSTVNALGESAKTHVTTSTADHDDDIIVENPTVPTGILVSPMIASLSVFWDLAGYAGHGYTNMYYQSVFNTNGVPGEPADFDKAELIASSVSNGQLVNTGGSSSGYLWLTNVNIDKVESATSSPVFAIPLPITTGTVSREDLDEELTSELDNLDEGLTEAIEGLAKIDLVEGDVEGGALAGIGAIIDQQHRGDKQRFEVHNGDKGLLAIIEENYNIIAGENGIIVDLENSITTEFTNVNETITANANEITRVESDAEKARVTLQLDYTAKFETVNSKTDANAIEITKVESDAASARALMQSQLSSEIDTVDGKTSANATEITKVESDAASARALMQQTLQSDINGNSSAIQQNMQSITTINADGTVAYNNQWGVKSSINGIQRGVGFYDDGTNSSFLVLANTFAVLDTDGKPTNPFVVENGKTYIDDAFIKDAYIESLVTSQLVTDKLYAQTITSVKIQSGDIVGSNITGGLFRTSEGTGFRIEIGEPTDTYAMWAGTGAKTDANAIFYLKNNGDAYFGGSLSGGVYRNEMGTSDTNYYPDDSYPVILGAFGTNGRTKTYVVSYDLYASSQTSNEITPSRDTQLVWQLQKLSGSSWYTITSGTFTGNFTSEYEAEFNKWYNTEVCSGSSTYIDNSSSTDDITLRIKVVEQYRYHSASQVNRQILNLISTEE